MISGLIIKMFSGGADSSQSRLVDAMPNVIEEKIATAEIPKKFRADIEILQKLYGKQFKSGLKINWALQQALEILPRERKRVDAYDSLKKYLIEKWGVELTIKYNKTK